MLKFLRGLFGPSPNRLTELIHENPHDSLNSQTPDLALTPLEVSENSVTSPTITNEIADNPVLESTPYNSSMDLAEYQYPDLSLLNKQTAASIAALTDSSPDFQLPIVWCVRASNIIVKDLAVIGSFLVAGTQETGKTNFLHQIITSLLYKKHPSQLKLALVDTKGLEFGAYRLLEKHFLAKLPRQSNSILKELTETVRTLESLVLK